jgi:hypothetical protein
MSCTEKYWVGGDLKKKLRATVFGYDFCGLNIQFSEQQPISYMLSNKMENLSCVIIRLTIDIWKQITQKATMLTRSCISITGLRKASSFITKL